MNGNYNRTEITNASTCNEIHHHTTSEESLNLRRKPDPIVVDELNSQSNSSTQSTTGVPFRIMIIDFSRSDNTHNTPFPPVIHCRPAVVPEFVPRHLKKDKRTYRFNCSFFSPTSSISNINNFISNEEHALIRCIHKMNCMRMTQAITASRKSKMTNTTASNQLPLYQIIAFGACRGKNQKNQKESCDIEFIWIRSNEYISLMVLCDPCHVDGTNVFHSRSCNRTQSKVSPDLIQLGLQFGSQVARMKSAIPPNPHPMLQYDHLANDPRNQLYKSSCKKRISLAVSQRNCRIKNEVRKIQQSVKHDYKSDETLDAFIPSLKQSMNIEVMDIESFCNLANDMEKVQAHRSSIVILRNDVTNDSSAKTRWEYLVFVHIGVLELYLKIIEMSTYSNAFTSIIDGVTIIDNVRALIMSCCDYRRSHYPVMFAICRNESKCATFTTIATYNEIIYRLGGKIPSPKSPIRDRNNLFRFIMLIDGSPALDAASTEAGAEVINCKTHMNERKTGNGTVGINDRGSLGRYLKQKSINRSPRKFIEYLNSCLFFLTDSRAYSNVLFMFYKHLLHHWLTEESKLQLKALVEADATISDVSDAMNRYISPYVKYVYKHDEKDGNKASTKVLKRETPADHVSEERKLNKNLHKCERIVIWFAAFYFPYFSKPRYGPGHIDGNPFDTNGGESLNNQFQQDAKMSASNTGCTAYHSFFRAVSENSQQKDTFQSFPVVSKGDMEEVLKYCHTKKGPRNKVLDPFFLYIVCYNARTHKLIDRGEMIAHIRNSSNNGGTVIYIPSQHLLESLLKKAKKDLISNTNTFGYPKKADDNIEYEQEQKKLFPILYNLVIDHLNAMHPDNLGVADDKCPTLEDIGRYVFKHASRLPSKSDVSNVNGRKPSTKDNAVEECMNTCLDKYLKSRGSSKRNEHNPETEDLNIFQRALGSFIIIKIDRDKVTSNDENYFRFASSFFSNFFSFLAFGDFPHNIDNVNWPIDWGQEGKEVCSNLLYKKMKQLFVEFPKNDTMNDPSNLDPLSSV